MIEKLSTGYRAKTYIGRMNGKSIYSNGKIRKTIKEAKQDEQAQERVRDVKRVTGGMERPKNIKDLAYQFLSSTKYQDYSERTQRDWQYWLDAEILPQWGAIRLNSVNARMIESWLSDLNTRMTYQTWHKPYSIFRIIIRYGCKNGDFNIDPTEYVDIPKHSDQHQPLVWTEDECRKFLESSVDSRIYPMVYTHIAYGMRVGELCGLEWDYVTDRTIEIIHGIDRYGNITDLKTESSHRTLPLLPDVGHLLPQRSGRWVFVNRDGNAYRPEVYSKAVQKLMQKADVPVIPTYNIRHTWATLHSDMPEEQKEYWLGHTQKTVTGRFYTDISGIILESILGKTC